MKNATTTKTLILATLTVLTFMASASAGWCLNPQPLPPRWKASSVPIVTIVQNWWSQLTHNIIIVGGRH